MKLKKEKMNYKLLAKLLLFICITFSSPLLAKEKNYIVALVDKDPITFIDLKEKAKLIHYTQNKNINYKQIQDLYKKSLDVMIEEKLLISEALKYNKDILKLSKKDSLRLLLPKFSIRRKLNFYLKNKN